MTNRSQLGCLLAAFLPVIASAQPAGDFLAAPTPGLIESGAPGFDIVSLDALGMTGPAIDLHRLPDGRLLVMGQEELALGDGGRWVRFARAGDQPHINLERVIVDHDGAIYAGYSNAFARLELQSDDTWRFVPVARIEPSESYGDPQLTHVAEANGRWFWWWGAGPVFEWHPGLDPRVVGVADNPRAFFSLNGVIHLSDGADGSLYQLRDARFTRRSGPPEHYAESTITATAPLANGRVLVGTTGRGLLVWDGDGFAPFASRGLLARPIGISALCALGQGLFAAASNNIGIIFFDREANILQVLDRSNDHRLARTAKLLTGSDGALWALLNDGLARVDFPSRVSHFEALVDTGLAYAKPFRHEGRLWLLSDGYIQRGVYDDDQRIRGFTIDSPPGYANELVSLDGHLLAGSREGLFLRRADATWARISDVSSPLIRRRPVEPGRWLYAAEEEVGWLRKDDAQTFRVERIPRPGFGHVYGAVTDAAGDFWVELGTGRVARVKPTLPRPTVTAFGPGGVLGSRWPNLFLFEGEARVNAPWQIFHLDPVSDQLRLDDELFERIPQMRDVLGRPATDALGRVWLTHEGRLQILEPSEPGLVPVPESLPAGLQPLHIYPQADAVVWLHEPQRLARYDPTVPLPPRPALQTYLARVQPAGRATAAYPPFDDSAPLEIAAGALVLQALAIGAPARQAVSFEHRLDGGDGIWSETGANGIITLGGLEPGDYRLRVRVRAGDQLGEEATLPLRVPLPWFRTPLALAGFTLAAAGIIVLTGWLSTQVARRRTAYLNRLVSARTEDLNQANLQLGRQVEQTEHKARELEASQQEIRQLNTELEQRVQQRTRELHDANRDLEAFSYSVAHDLRSPIGNIRNFAHLLRTIEPPEPDSERDQMTAFIIRECDHLIELVQSFLAFATVQKAAIRWERVELGPLLGEIRQRLMRDAGARSVTWRIADPLPMLEGDRTLLQQVFTNLLGNALKFTGEREVAEIEVNGRVSSDGRTVIITVRDNGAGFDPAATRLFEPFRRAHDAKRFKGTGIGLANVHRIVTRHGGTITATAAPEQGATFTVCLPRHRPSSDSLPPI